MTKPKDWAAERKAMSALSKELEGYNRIAGFVFWRAWLGRISPRKVLERYRQDRAAFRRALLKTIGPREGHK